MKLTLKIVLTILIIKSGYSQQKNEHISFDDLIKNTAEHVENEDYLKAAKELEKMNPNDSMYNDVLTTVSYYYLLAEENEKCIETCDKGIKNTKFSSPYFFYLNKIAALSRDKKDKEAIETASEAIEKYPKSNTLYFNRAISYEAIGETKKAVSDLIESIKINPYHKKSHIRLANLCAEQNQTAQALMALNVYLILSPDGDYSAGVLNLANTIASRREPYTVNKKVSITKNDDDFEELNLILNNKIALNKKYKTKNKIRSSFAIQTHVLLEQLKSHEIEGGFWNDKYVPFFKWIYNNNYYNNLTYTTHYDSDYNKYKSLANKNTATVKNFIKLAYNKWSNIVGESKVKVNGKEITKRHLYENLKLLGIGEVRDEKMHGEWKFYTEEGALSTTGRFDHGKRDGKWLAYEENGDIERELHYENDEQTGTFTIYKNKVVKHSSDYISGKATGTIKNYYSTGAVKNKMDYKDDLLNGDYKVYFRNGQALNHELKYKDDKAYGTIKYYFQNGALYSTATLENNKTTGLETTYYNDSTVYSKLNYIDGIIDGEQTYFFQNGNISNKGVALEGNYIGTWEEFYIDGTKKSVNNYDKGVLNGKQTNYNRNGVINSEYNYKKGDFISYKTFDKEGNLLKETKKQNGKFFYSTSYTNGNIRTEGLYNVKGGKVGEWKYYDKNGSLTNIENYSENGDLEGSTISYYSNGAVSTEKHYKNDSLNGPYYSYYINGNLHKQGHYLNDKTEGEWVSYYKSGKPSWTGYYNNGKQFGKSVNYTVDNKISVINYYYNDELYKEELYTDSINSPIVIVPPYKANDVLTKKYINGKIRSTSELKYNFLDGAHKYYHLNGKIRTEGNFILGDREGLWKWYYDNGQTETQGQYRNGDQHGEWKEFFENGQLQSVKNYILGNEQGTFKSYNEKGVLIRESQYENGELNGFRKFYSEDGKLQLIRYYEYGYLIGYSYHDKNGKEIPMIKIENETAKITSYFDNGKIARELEIIKGEFNGTYKEYYYTGQLFEIQSYKNTINEGEHIVYYPNGQIMEESMYKSNKTDGKKTYYYEDGTIKKISHYKEDKKINEEYYFDKKGNKIKTYIYFNDAIVGQK